MPPCLQLPSSNKSWSSRSRSSLERCRWPRSRSACRLSSSKRSNVLQLKLLSKPRWSDWLRRGARPSDLSKKDSLKSSVLSRSASAESKRKERPPLARPKRLLVFSVNARRNNVDRSSCSVSRRPRGIASSRKRDSNVSLSCKDNNWSVSRSRSKENSNSRRTSRPGCWRSSRRLRRQRSTPWTTKSTASWT